MMNEKLADQLQQLRIDHDETPVERKGLFRRKTFIAVVLAIVFGMGFSLVYYQGNRSDAQSSQAGDTASKPGQTRAAETSSPSSDGDVAVLTAAGYIIAKNQVEVGSKIIGRIQHIGVEVGDLIKQGQIIARLESNDLEAQLKQAEADLQVAQQRYAELIAGSRSQEVEQARAKLGLAEANLRVAAANLERYKKLYQQGVVPAQQLDSAQNDYDVRQAETRTAREAFGLVQEGPRPETAAVLRGEINQALTKVEYYKTQLKNAQIESPLTGIVLEKIVQVGQVVAPGVGGGQGLRTGVVRVASPENLRVELDINEGDIGKIYSHQPVDITLESLPDKTFKGFVATIYPEANRQKGTIKVEVALFKVEPLLKPELSAKVVFKQPPAASAATH